MELMVTVNYYVITFHFYYFPRGSTTYRNSKRACPKESQEYYRFSQFSPRRLSLLTQNASVVSM